MEVFDNSGYSPWGIFELGNDAQYGPKWGRRQKSVEELPLDLTELGDDFKNLRGGILVVPQCFPDAADRFS